MLSRFREPATSRFAERIAQCRTERRQASAATYALATGQEAANRLRILHDLYGPGTRHLLKMAGLRRGMRVIDLGCGTGLVTRLMAKLVGPAGLAIGIDASPEQIAEARQQVPLGMKNITFFAANATQTGLPEGEFDLVFCRFLLLHLPQPELALAEMLRLLRPGGILVCEDADLTTAGSEPASALDAFADLWGRLGPSRGLDFTLGRRLYHLVRAAGGVNLAMTFHQPVRAHGMGKRLLELSVAEAGPAFISAGLTTATALAQTLAEMRRLTDDESVLALMPRMAQVWARKPASHVRPS